MTGMVAWGNLDVLHTLRVDTAIILLCICRKYHVITNVDNTT